VPAGTGSTTAAASPPAAASPVRCPDLIALSSGGHLLLSSLLSLLTHTGRRAQSAGCPRVLREGCPNNSQHSALPNTCGNQQQELPAVGVFAAQQLTKRDQKGCLQDGCSTCACRGEPYFPSLLRRTATASCLRPVSDLSSRPVMACFSSQFPSRSCSCGGVRQRPRDALDQVNDSRRTPADGRP
jgi:hypothetical protein